MALAIGIKVEILVARRMKLAELWKDLWSLDYQIWGLKHPQLRFNSRVEQKNEHKDPISLISEMEESRQILFEEIKITQIAVEKIRGEINFAAQAQKNAPKT